MVVHEELGGRVCPGPLCGGYTGTRQKDKESREA